MQEVLFTDRRDAGRQLASRMGALRQRHDLVVLGLPRGGVPVAYEVAHALGAPLDVLVIRKLGVPGQPELAFGAIANGGIVVYNDDIVQHYRITREIAEEVAAREEAELRRRLSAYRRGRGEVPLAGRTAVIVDDGLATGATMRAAVAALKRRAPAEVIVGVPAASGETADLISREVDGFYAVALPEPFYSVGGSYGDFSQTGDEEVEELLAVGRGGG